MRVFGIPQRDAPTEPVAQVDTIAPEAEQTLAQYSADGTLLALVDAEGVSVVDADT